MASTPTSRRPSQLVSILLLVVNNILLFSALGGVNAITHPHHLLDDSSLHRRQTPDPNENLGTCFSPCTYPKCGGLCSGGSCPTGGKPLPLTRRNNTTFLPPSSDDIPLWFRRVREADGYDNKTLLDKRVFRMDPNSNIYRKFPTVNEVDTYLPLVSQNAEDAYFNPALQTVSDDPSNECARSQQVVFGNQPFQIITAGLCGCTVVTLVSKRAVWMAHFWQVYSNGGDPITQPVAPPPDDAFRERVLDFIRGNAVTKPSPREGYPYIPPLGDSVNPDLFRDVNSRDKPELFIMSPKYRSVSYYPAQVKAIQDTMKSIVGNDLVVTEYEYIPLDENNPRDAAQIGNNAKGFALFQYDPDSDGRGSKGWRLFYERYYKTRSSGIGGP